MLPTAGALVKPPPVRPRAREPCSSSVWDSRYGRVRVRHPLYSGVILAMLGTALATAVVWLITAAMTGGYFVYTALVEEKTMTRIFPAAYPPYKRSTKMLVPFIL